MTTANSIPPHPLTLCTKLCVMIHTIQIVVKNIYLRLNVCQGIVCIFAYKFGLAPSYADTKRSKPASIVSTNASGVSSKITQQT